MMRRNRVLAMAILAWPVAACSSDAAPASETTGSSSSGSAASSSSAADPSESSGTTVVTPGSSSGGGSSSSSDTTGGASSTGPVFPDPCDPFTQDCPSGFKCNPYANDGGNAWNATICVPVDAEPDGYGEPCTVVDSGVSGFDSCDVGAMCLVGGDTLEGECVELCSGSVTEPMCVQENASCRISAQGSFAPCFINCDPLGEDCDEQEVCVYTSGGPFSCAAAGPAEYGEACEFLNGCGPGLGCFEPAASVCDVEEEGCCLPYCDLQAPDCPDALACVSFFPGGAPEGLEDVGLCFEPE